MRKQTNLLASLCALLRALECDFPVDEVCYNQYVHKTLDIDPQVFTSKIYNIINHFDEGIEDVWTKELNLAYNIAVNKEDFEALYNIALQAIYF